MVPSSDSLETFRMHLNHVLRKFGGASFLVKDLVAADLQDYLDKRVRRKGKKTVPLSPVTLRKELASFRACFNWAVQTGLLTGSFPNRGLRFPKGEDKRPFMTWEKFDFRPMSPRWSSVAGDQAALGLLVSRSSADRRISDVRQAARLSAMDVSDVRRGRTHRGSPKRTGSHEHGRHRF